MREYIKDLLKGVWANEKLGQAIELKTDGTLTYYSAAGATEGEYTYYIGPGNGTMVIDYTNYEFSASVDTIETEGVVFTKRENGFDIGSFIDEFGNPLIGEWYDAAGIMGTYTFTADGTVTLVSYGEESFGTYTFDNSTSFGSATFSGHSLDISMNNGDLTVSGRTFIKQYVEQKNAKDRYETVSGTWYDKQGQKGTIKFSDDGTAVMTGVRRIIRRFRRIRPRYRDRELNAQRYRRQDRIQRFRWLAGPRTVWSIPAIMCSRHQAR